jgi:hypothetical protein
VVLRVRNMFVRDVQNCHNNENKADNHWYKALLIMLELTHLLVLCHVLLRPDSRWQQVNTRVSNR